MTYSIGTTGASANSVPQVETLKLSDPQAVPGGMALAMQLGTPFLCKRPDGSEAYYKFDAERSTPDVPILLKV